MDSAQRIIVFNEGAEKMFGYAAGEVMGQPLTVLLPEHSRAVHAARIEEFGRSAIAARRMGERGEIAGRRKNGEIFPAEASISKVGPDTARVYTAVLRDITERKQAEAERTRLLERAETARAAAESARAAAESAERRAAFLADASALLDRSLDYETTLQNLAGLVVPERADVCFIDVVEGGATHRVASAAANDAMREIARQLHRFPRHSDEPYLTREAIVTGRSVLLADATRAALDPVTQHAQHLELLMALEPRSCMMVPLIARGHTLGAMAFVASGAARRYSPADLALAEELGHRAALAVDNARLYGAAQRATRARDEILGIVSHDLRNPLSAIAMCGSALDESLSTADDGVRYMVDTIRQSADWMNRLIQDLLDIASIETGHLAMERHRQDAAPLLAQLETIFAGTAAEHGVTLAIATSSPLAPVMADGERLLQVLTNLVANALKFTPAGGTIHVTAEPDGACVRFAVRDTGAGIPPEDLPHLFDRFWQARRGASERGTGLGLAISKGIVEGHGGSIHVVSQVGSGSTFSFTIPTAPR